MRLNLINNLNEAIRDSLKGYKSPLAYFGDIREDFTRLELMIIDSAIKKMPMERLDATLLLSQDEYDKMLQDITIKLIKRIESKAHRLEL